MRRTPAFARTLLALACLGLGACASRPGHYYQDDGPPEHPPAGLAQTPDAVPRAEPLNPHANRPYSALGRGYSPDTGDGPFEQRGMASWYGRQYHGNATASGEPYDMFAMSAAHTTLPIPSYARVTRVSDGRSVIVRINDRGPFVPDRVIDLSYAAAARLGIIGPGSAEVTVQKITARDIAAGTYGARTPIAATPITPDPGPAAPAAPAATATGTVPAAEPAPVALPTELAISTRVVAAAPGPQEIPLPAPAAAVRAPGNDPATPPAAEPSAAPVVSAPIAPAAPAPSPVPAVPAPVAPAVPAAVAAPVIAPPAVAPAVSAPDAQTPKPAPPAPAPSAAPAGKWAVQLGAFALPANAQAMAEELRALLAGPGAEALPADSRQVRVEFDGRLHRVLVGAYAQRGAAQGSARQLRQFLDRETAIYRH